MLQFTAGSTKGGVAQGDLFNDPFRLGQMTDARVDYTGANVAENIDEKEDTFTPSWTPVAPIVCSVCKEEDKGLPKPGVEFEVADEAGVKTWVSVELIDGSAEKPEGATGRVRYIYDNVTIPQNDIPQLTAHMEGIELAAKARRIAVYYSQMAAFQAKTEMGIDLGEVLATQACSELSYEIDTEVVKLLANNATAYADLTWNKRLPVGVSKRDHYAGFAEVIELASQHIYDATQKHAANYMLISSAIKPILVMMEGWKAASTAKMNGPYFAGELNGIRVYVSPALAPGKFVLGYNGGDMVTSAAVYAPYMAIVPTQLLGFADGAMSQGFSTLYDLKLLNKALLVAGEVIDQRFESGVIANA